ncbi:MAG: GDSL-type esterase/lipase family protein [Clostridiales bacterium]|nr:GDSL-type esterase/lipase family protein [Clostridiales bacterium]
MWPAAALARSEAVAAQSGAVLDQPESDFAEGAGDFSDVGRRRWSYPSIYRLRGAGIVHGYGDGSFRPEDYVTREQFASVLLRIPGFEPSEAAPRETAYADVEPGRWSYGAIRSAREYFKSREAGRRAEYFEPEAPALRGEIVEALVKLSRFPKARRPSEQPLAARLAAVGEFGEEVAIDTTLLLKIEYELDRPVSELLPEHGYLSEAQIPWLQYAAVAADKGILTGFPDASLKLGEPVMREQMCAMVARAIALSELYAIPDVEIPQFFVPDRDSGYYDSFFDGAAFVGDSVTMGLRNYVSAQRGGASPGLLGSASFLAAGSYGLRHATNKFSADAPQLSVGGRKAPVEDALASLGAQSLFIMLGMNDGVSVSADAGVSLYHALLDKILSKNPGITIYVQLCTPVAKAGEKRNLHNSGLDAFNEAVKLMCAERGIEWVDTSAPLKDGSNGLRPEYASDGYVHMSYAGAQAWVGALRDFAMEKYFADEWRAEDANPEDYPGSYFEEAFSAD